MTSLPLSHPVGLERARGQTRSESCNCASNLKNTFATSSAIAPCPWNGRVIYTQVSLSITVSTLSYTTNSFTIPIPIHQHQHTLQYHCLPLTPLHTLPITRPLQFLSDELSPSAGQAHRLSQTHNPNNTTMKLLTAEDEAKFYRYVPSHTSSSYKTTGTNPATAQQSNRAPSAASSA